MPRKVLCLGKCITTRKHMPHGLLSSPHILHVASRSSRVLVFLEWYSLVDNSCSYNSLIPAIECVGAILHSTNHEKHSLSRSSSSHLAVTSFPCHLCCRMFSPHLLSTTSLTHGAIFFPSPLYTLSFVC